MLSTVPELRAKYYGALPGLESILCYASGYPSWDTAVPDDVRAALPEAWHDKVLVENALGLFRSDRGAGEQAQASREE